MKRFEGKSRQLQIPSIPCPLQWNKRGGERLLLVRQKAIRIANQCEYGWTSTRRTSWPNTQTMRSIYIGLKCKLAARPQQPRIERKKEFLRKDWRSKAQLQTSSPTTSDVCSVSLMQSSSCSFVSSLLSMALGPVSCVCKMGHFNHVLSQTMSKWLMHLHHICYL